MDYGKIIIEDKKMIRFTLNSQPAPHSTEKLKERLFVENILWISLILSLLLL